MKDIVIIAKTGAGKNFMKHLLSPPKTSIHFPDVNEYRSSVDYGTFVWRNSKFKTIALKDKCTYIKEFHPKSEDGFNSYTEHDIIGNKVYYITTPDEETHQYVMMIGYMKVRMLRSYYGLLSMDRFYDKMIHNTMNFKKFVRYSKFLKQHNLMLHPLSQWGFDIYNEIKDGKYKVDVIRHMILDKIENIPYFDDDNLSELTEVEYINYKDFFIDSNLSNTIFDKYRHKVDQYHKRNLDFLKRMSVSWKHDFIQYVPI